MSYQRHKTANSSGIWKASVIDGVPGRATLGSSISERYLEVKFTWETHIATIMSITRMFNNTAAVVEQSERPIEQGIVNSELRQVVIVA